MRILVTNDDGIDAEGLHVLARVLCATDHDVVVAAPDFDASGTGAALGVSCAEIWLKLEHLQVAGSFKARGMYNRLLSNRIPESGVIVASGGVYTPGA